MLRPYTPKSAGLSAVLTALLAVTALTLGAPRALAQKSAAVPVKPVHTIMGSDSFTMTPGAVLNGGAIRIAPLEPTQKLHVVLSIKPPHMAEEEQFLAELVTKGSPNFHKFLTAEQWNARFAPSAEDEQRVVDWVKSQGLTVTQRYANRLLVEADGRVDTVEKAFGVTMNKYQVGSEVDFSNDRNPVIPSALTGIISNVLGLSNVERPRRLGASKSASKLPLPAASSLTGSTHGNGDPTKAANASLFGKQTPGGSPSKPSPADNYPLDYKGFYAMDPANVQSSQGYNFNALQRLSHCCNEWGNASGSPSESSIALIGYGAFSTTDTAAFFNAYGMAWNINWFCFTGGSEGSTCPGADGEAPLDVEYAGAMANSYGDYHATAHIYEYEMADNQYATYSGAFNRILSDNYAKVVSTSYGWQENVGFSGSIATGTMHPIFNNMLGQGFTLIAASGDSGASTGCGDATSLNYPASDPDFIAAGGTQLNMNADGTFYSEGAWQGETWSGACGTNHGGSTGGQSVLFSAPSWQSSMAGSFYLWKGSTEYIETGATSRMVPDIALTANPDVLGQWYYAGGGWSSEGGTSIVAPELAGFFAQENSYLDFVGNKCGAGSTACSPVGNAAPFIYYNGSDGAPHNPFYDMTSGCNNNDITSAYGLYYYCAYSGWDPVTGWGSANMLQLAWGINWELIPAVGNPSISFSGPSTGVWYNSNQQVNWSVADAGSGSYPAPGNAGFSQGWDSIPSDPTSEPHGGDGNSFYSGPEFPFSSTGCLAFDNNGCAGGSGQGCHTAWVQVWDNQGRTSTQSYGPLCYDNVAPAISVSNSPAPNANGWWTGSSVQVTLTPSDATSGILHTWYAIDTGSCYPGNYGACNVYTGPFTYSAEGAHYIYYFTEDNAGNFSSEPYEYLYIDRTLPTTTSSLSGTIYSGSIYSTPVQVTLSASDAISGIKKTWYKLDGGGQILYAGPFTVSALGSHNINYWSVDNAGNGEVHHNVGFSVKGTPGITWGTPAAIAYLTPLSATQLNATSGIAGTFAYSPAAGTVLHAGWTTITATFTPTDPTKYISVSTTRGQLVNKATPVLHWGTPAAITYGTKLSATQLDATANTSGTFVYSPASGALLPGGWTTITATFHPSDTADFVSTSTTRGQFVNKTTANIIWNNPAPITHGTALSATQLNAVVHGVNGGVLAGTSTYAPPAGTILAVGTHTLKITFAPTDTTDYLTTTKTVSITVN
jgi:hypothetical protein